MIRVCIQFRVGVFLKAHLADLIANATPKKEYRTQESQSHTHPGQRWYQKRSGGRRNRTSAYGVAAHGWIGRIKKQGLLTQTGIVGLGLEETIW